MKARCDVLHEQLAWNSRAHFLEPVDKRGKRVVTEGKKKTEKAHRTTTQGKRREGEREKCTRSPKDSCIPGGRPPPDHSV